MSNTYVRDKLSIKLNLCMSAGKKTEGVLTDAVIDKMINTFNGYGHYEIIWDSRKLFPISLSRLSDNVDVRLSGKQYVVLYEGKFERVLFPNQYIEFNIAEYRNQKLKELLN